MPHKHTRRARDKDLSVFDLPPSQNAQPLPVTTVSKRKEAQPTEKPKSEKPKSEKPKSENKSRKRKRENDQKDDTPRAFKRLIAFGQGKKFRNGLDDGRGTKQGSRKPKKGQDPSPLGKEDSSPAAVAPASAPAVPTIKPGEKLSEYSARVDAALPLGGLINNAASNGKDPLGLKVPKTRKEKKMHKMYAQWREEDEKIREKREEELELAEEQAMEDEEHGVTWKLDLDGSASGKRKKARKGKKGSSSIAGGDDMWKELRRKRAEGKIGLNEVAKAPPELHVGSLAKHKVVHGAAVEVGSVPKAAGSLRRREELAKVREGVVASYRRLAEERRATATSKLTVS